MATTAASAVAATAILRILRPPGLEVRLTYSTPGRARSCALLANRGAGIGLTGHLIKCDDPCLRPEEEARGCLRGALPPPRARGVPLRAGRARQRGGRRGRDPDDVHERVPRRPVGRAAAEARELAPRDRPQRLPPAL